MKQHAIVILNPYDDKPEAVLGPFTAYEAFQARNRLVKAALDGDEVEGYTVHPDCIGEIVTLSTSIEELVVGSGTPPSGFFVFKKEGGGG